LQESHALGVTITNHLSAGEHVRNVIGKCAQSLHALKLLCCHGMSDDSLTHIYKAVVLAKLLYVSPTWWGFTSAADNVLKHLGLRAVRLRLYKHCRRDPTRSLAADMNDNLFTNT